MIGAGVTVGRGAVIRDSIIMKDTVIGDGCQVDKAIIAEDVVVDNNCIIGVGNEAPSKLDSRIYAFGLATIGEKSYIPKNVKIGRNTAISGKTELADYPNGELQSGEYIVKAGEM